MESATERLELERVLEIDASPETVWQLLVDPERAITWWGLAASFDPRPGGTFRLEVSQGNVASGAFVEVEPPASHPHVYTSRRGGGPELVPPGSSTVEIELRATATGTQLRLVHRDLPDARSAGQHGLGWDHYLARLAVRAAGGDPGPDSGLSVG